jgi:hypothetical protein
MVPRRFDNLLLPVPVSASHVGYSTLRMEPVRMAIGYAAGLAADQAIRRRVPVGRVDVSRLQEALLAAGQALVWTPDLDSRAPGFAELQRARLAVLVAFHDVPATNPHAVGIAGLHRAGVVTGFAGRAFRPAAPLPRGQFASLVARLAGLEPVAPTLPDATGSHGGAIGAVTRAGLMSGYPDGTFRPDLHVTREQAATVVARLLGLVPVAKGPFADVTPGSRHAGWVNALARAGVLAVPPDRLFRPGDRLRRDEAASLLWAARRHRGRLLPPAT